MNSKIFKVATFCLTSALSVCDSFGVDAVAQAYDLNYDLKTLDRLVSKAKLEMTRPAAYKSGQFYTVANNNEGIVFFEVCDVTPNGEDSFFSSLSIDSSTFVELFSCAFAPKTWAAYSDNQRSNLTVLLKNVVKSWKRDERIFGPFIEDLCVRDVFQDLSTYNTDLHNQLTNYISAVVETNVLSRCSFLSDLTYSNISLISYITGTRILVLDDHGLLDPLNMVLPNLETSSRDHTNILYNTGTYWLKCDICYDMSCYVNTLRNKYDFSEYRALIASVKYFEIPWLHFFDSWQSTHDMFFNDDNVDVLPKFS